MGDHGHVVPVAAVFEMFGFDFPHHVVEFFDGGTVHRGFKTAVVRLRYGDGRHFAGAVRQRVVGRFRAGDGQAHAARHRGQVRAFGHMGRFQPYQSRAQSRLRHVEQIFRVRSAERLHRLVGVADEQQSHATVAQCGEKVEAGECGVLEIVDDDEFRQVGRFGFVHGGRGVDHELRGVETVLVRICLVDGLVVFGAQREGEPPLHAQSFASFVERAVLVGSAGDQHVFEFRFRADLVHAGKHVAQLVGEGVGGVVHHHARPVGDHEVGAQ